MSYHCSNSSCHASQRCSTDDKPRAMSNLFEHCRGAKEEEISWSSNVRVVFLYAYDRKNTIWQTLYRRTDSLRRIPRGWPSCIRLSLRQLAGWAIVEHPITKTGIVEKKKRWGGLYPPHLRASEIIFAVKRRKDLPPQQPMHFASLDFIPLIRLG